jgi:hypothetical protein
MSMRFHETRVLMMDEDWASSRPERGSNRQHGILSEWEKVGREDLEDSKTWEIGSWGVGGVMGDWSIFMSRWCTGLGI